MVKNPNVIILKSAGTNCDLETKIAFELSGANAQIVGFTELLRRKKQLSKFHILVIPGGFSYGDDIAAGKVWATEIRHYLSEEMKSFSRKGKLILGICNGFQVLVKLGILPGFDGNFKQSVTLTFNDKPRYVDRWVYLKKSSRKSAFLKNFHGLLNIPVAHTEGKFITKNEEILKRLFRDNQIALQYVDSEGNLTGYPANPNGSVGNIAGICDPSGRILGMMPHPERAVLKTHYPNWRREKIRTSSMGKTIIKNGIEYARKNLV